jgi:hypothetical protein
MSIFGRIMSAIWGQTGASAAQAKTPAATAAPQTAPAPTASAPSPATGGAPVDVERVLTDLASRKGQKLDWRRSIVDLMKLLDLDSGLQARQELARELKYTGDTNDSAAMNVWLHKQVMTKLAENGGKVPEDLKR